MEIASSTGTAPMQSLGTDALHGRSVCTSALQHSISIRARGVIYPAHLLPLLAVGTGHVKVLAHVPVNRHSYRGFIDEQKHCAVPCPRNRTHFS